MAWTSRIDYYIFGVARSPTEQVENDHPVVAIRLAKGIAVDVDFLNLWNSGKSSNFSRICQLIVSKVHTLQGEQPLNASKRCQTV
jgi:hypothetical protein